MSDTPPRRGISAASFHPYDDSSGATAATCHPNTAASSTRPGFTPDASGRFTDLGDLTLRLSAVGISVGGHLKLANAMVQDVLMWTVNILGDLEVRRGGHLVSAPKGIHASTLVLIALSGSVGISPTSLSRALSTATRPEVGRNALQRRVTELRNRFDNLIPDSREKGDLRYRLSEHNANVDAVRFVDAVRGLGDPPNLTQVDELLGLWRGNPIPPETQPAHACWQPVADAQRVLIDVLDAVPAADRACLANLAAFAKLFPHNSRLRRIGCVSGGKPRLLIAEDQIMEDLELLLADEFEIVPVTSYTSWKEVRDSGKLDGVRGALLDRHLDIDDASGDSLGTTVIAEHLRKETEIPAVLMSVDVDASVSRAATLLAKYRLLDVIRKNQDGKLNRTVLIEAARSLVDNGGRARRLRVERFVESTFYHVEENFGPAAVNRCREERDDILRLLQKGQLDAAERDARDFTVRWRQ